MMWVCSKIASMFPRRAGLASRFGTRCGAGAHGRLLSFTLLLPLLVGTQAATVSLGWGPSPDPSVRGYRIYYGLQGQPLASWIGVGAATTGSVSGLAANATYSFAVCAYNEAGIESVLSPSVSASTGTTGGTPVGSAPSVVLAGTSTTSTLIAPAAVDLRADVTPNGHVISRVDFIAGTEVLAMDSTAPYTVTWSGIAAGNYSVFARVYYDASSRLDSAPFALSVAPPVVVDPTAPVVSLTAPTDGSLRIAGLSIGLSASVTPNGHTISKVQFLDGTLLLGEDTSAPYSYIWSSVPAGRYAINARVIYDGSLSSSSSVSTVTVEEPPVIAITSPLVGASFGAPATVQLASNADANGHTLVKVRYYSGGTLIGESSTAPYNVSWSGLGVGTYSVTAVLQYDSSRTVSSAPVSFAVLTLPPSVSLINPVDGSSYVLPADVALSASVTPNGHSPSKIQFLVDGVVSAESLGPDFSSKWTPQVSGNVSIVARLHFDGGSILDSAAVSIRVLNLPPTVEIVSPTPGRFLSAGVTTLLETSVAPNGYDIEGVDFLDGGVLLGTSTVPPYALEWTPTVNGTHSLTARILYGGGKSAVSPEVVVSVGDLPPPWLSLDIADTTLAGSSTALENGFRIAGSGVIFGTSDSFRFVYQTMDGDGEIQARVDSTSETGRSGGVGVMIRESTSPASRHAFMAVVPTQEWRWERRGDTGGITWIANYGALSLPAAWVRLVRAGDVFSGYTSTDGINWTLQNSRTITMGTSVLVGLAVSSGTAGVLNTTEFSEVIVRP